MIRSEIRQGNLKWFRYHHRIRVGIQVGDHGGLQRNGRDGERKRDKKIIPTAPCSVMQIVVTMLREKREGRGPDPQQ